MRDASLDRREFLRGAAAVVAASGAGLVGCRDRLPEFVEPGGWHAGGVAHLLPGASHERILLKASLREPLDEAPVLEVGRLRTRGEPGGPDGRFFTFDVRRLTPATEYPLRLVAADGSMLCDPWSLRTLPHPDADAQHVRLLCYTCAGGPELFNPLTGEDAFLRLPFRRRLLARALAFRPDVVIANGDHVYWDQRGRSGRLMGGGWIGWWLAGSFDRRAPVASAHNRGVLERAVGPQIAGLYGTLLRSTPVVFLRDDHDYSDNDEADETLRTFPPDRFMRDFADVTQRLYYPELLADRMLPSAYRSSAGLARSFGRLRYGRLLEALLYDCRGRLSNSADPLRGDTFSGFVPREIEAWLLERTRASDARHLIHMPSTPILWTAGKWGEWYPDTKNEAGALGLDTPKAFWPRGWKQQHDRLVAAASARGDRIPLFASGDLHATALGAIHENEGASLRDNPVISLLCGALGTAGPGWPSRFRGQRPLPSATLKAEEWIEPIEENGFSLLDVTPDRIDVSAFRWRPEDGIEAIDGLQPFATHILRRPKRS